MPGGKSGHVAETRADQGRVLLYAASVADGVSACLCPDEGATLSSLKVLDVSGVHELLYRGNDWRPVEGWSGHAPWLWPVAGRSYSRSLTGGEPDPQSLFHWMDQGRELPMPHHGFVRSRSWEPGAVKATHDHAEVSACYAPAARDGKVYPYKYKLESSLTVSCDNVISRFRVQACQTNSIPMPFIIGQHFTFDMRSWWGDHWLTGTIQGLGSVGWSLDELAIARDEIHLPGANMCLADDVLRNALIPTIPGQSVTLVSPDGCKKIAMEFDATSLPASDAALWVVHRDPAGRFFCLEPWVGWPNGLCSGRGRVMLEPGDVWSMSARLRIITSDRVTDVDSADDLGRVHVKPGVIKTLSTRTRRVVSEAESLSEES